MANHPNRRKAFKVRHMPGSSDTAGEGHFAVFGPAVDNTFAQGEALADLIERVLNAAYAAFAEKK